MLPRFLYFKKQILGISLGTVYRNLNLLAEVGDIKKIEGLDGSMHFDHNTHKHYHFICNSCKKIYDINADVIPDLADEISDKTVFIIEGIDISLNVTCHKCKINNYF